MDLILQLWGGGFYLLNKIFFALAEGRKPASKRIRKIAGWVFYILGVPAWVIILVGKDNWIAASIEAGGLPSMLLGLYSIYYAHKPTHKLLDLLAKYTTYFAIVLGIFYSIFTHGGINSLSQLFEMGVTVGFLVGSYLLAHHNRYGWLFFMLMNSSMASLMFIQNKPLLMIQQLISLSFIVYGFMMSGKNYTD